MRKTNCCIDKFDFGLQGDTVNPVAFGILELPDGEHNVFEIVQRQACLCFPHGARSAEISGSNPGLESIGVSYYTFFTHTQSKQTHFFIYWQFIPEFTSTSSDLNTATKKDILITEQAVIEVVQIRKMTGVKESDASILQTETVVAAPRIAVWNPAFDAQHPSDWTMSSKDEQIALMPQEPTEKDQRLRDIARLTEKEHDAYKIAFREHKGIFDLPMWNLMVSFGPDWG